jgi:glyoxalase family protein
MVRVSGIHHITAIASGARECVDFYTKVLGLRLVKKSVNQDQVEAYHLFFGDRTGEAGMDLTFFIFSPVSPGRAGVGEVGLISLAIREEALGFWRKRFEALKIDYHESKRWGRRRLAFKDADGQRLELVGVEEVEYARGVGEVWETKEIPAKMAIGYFESAKLVVDEAVGLTPVLDTMGYTQVDVVGESQRWRVDKGQRAAYLEVEEKPLMRGGVQGTGSVHHIAFGVRDEKEQLVMREKVVGLGLQVTGVIDRFYFKSVYFRTRAGILFELATLGPGFTVDEPEATLGQKLALPPFLEDYRREIEANLEVLET